MLPLPVLLLSVAAGAFDGEAALRHASALAALGPHPWGSPRGAAAAAYVAAQLRAAGLADVRLQEFESHGIRGANVVGVLRGAAPEFVVMGAHHDSAPGATGAYDDGGGVGVLIESARALARRPRPPRTVVFASWDGEEAESHGLGASAAGSGDHARSLGAEGRNLVAVLDVEMCGWKKGRPVFHPIPYADPLRPGSYVVTPAWLMRAALEAAGRPPASAGVGDPILSWLYQPAVRTFRVRLYGDDLSFLQAGLPAVFASDSSFWAFYPYYHQPEDTADKIDATSLARMGTVALAVVDALVRVPRGPASDPTWFAAFGHVLGAVPLLVIGALSVVPGLAADRGRRFFNIRLAQAAVFGFLLWRHPVPALWVFVVANAVTALPRRPWTVAAALLPVLLLLILGGAAWRRGYVAGLWLGPWEITAAAVAMVLLFAGTSRKAAGNAPKRGKGLPRRPGRRVLM
jgi:peptidase M28-like protein